MDWIKRTLTGDFLLKVGSLAIVSALAFTAKIDGTSALAFLAGAVLGTTGLALQRRTGE